jgi:AcrR family transcriptional regulator
MARPKEAILSRNLIRDQALAIIDEDGLDALTMRKLAARLGVQAASLYSHFPNKEAVLSAIADRLAKRIDASGFTDSWQEGLRIWANSYYSAMHWHPRAAPVVASGSLDLLSGSDEVHTGLLDHGWPDREATMVAAAAKFLVLGAATSASGDRMADTTPPSPADRLDQFADTIERASFSLALDALIRGFESLHTSVDTVRSVSAG